MFGYFLKYFLTAIGLVFVLFALGFLGVLFRLWPTSWPDEEIAITPDKMARLTEMRKQSKFHETMRPFYPGARSEPIRREAEFSVNSVIDKLITGLNASPRKSFVLATFKPVLNDSTHFDSEERDQMSEYFGQILEILGVESSNELLNVWRYGLPYGWLQPKSRT